MITPPPTAAVEAAKAARVRLCCFPEARDTAVLPRRELRTVAAAGASFSTSARVFSTPLTWFALTFVRLLGWFALPLVRLFDALALVVVLRRVCVATSNLPGQVLLITPNLCNGLMFGSVAPTAASEPAGIDDVH